MSKPKRIVLIRHGQSKWNLENRFTGWTDVDLTDKGVQEAQSAGSLLRDKGFLFSIAYTSYLKRAIKSTNFILDQMNLDWVPTLKTWRLNERHYGMLQGLNKAETAKIIGEDLVAEWRKSYDVPAMAMPADDPRSPFFDRRYNNIAKEDVPLTESLKNTIDRILPYWEQVILPSLNSHDDILVVAHRNSLRGIIKYLKNISDNDIRSFDLPTCVPYIFEFDEDLQLIKDYFIEK